MLADNVKHVSTTLTQRNSEPTSKSLTSGVTSKLACVTSSNTFVAFFSWSVVVLSVYTYLTLFGSFCAAHYFSHFLCFLPFFPLWLCLFKFLRLHPPSARLFVEQKDPESVTFARCTSNAGFCCPLAHTSELRWIFWHDTQHTKLIGLLTLLHTRANNGRASRNFICCNRV